ncbi:FAD-binding oxidoreductase [Pseudohalocynthiibacter aestuariivivens]|nr:FAD-dependent oxidoreductase [Pseudohalocynthiibacter aestuariivivens]QIE46717.1 FAD-binding oxidoreductase [Pseudohalocynthiibacter aestuariivivens]
MSGLIPHLSLWEATARPAPESVPLEGTTQADVAVIGGGFCGLSCALRLASGGADTVLLEAEAPGFGASGRNGGQLISGFKDDPETLIALHGPERGEAIARLGVSAGDMVADLIAEHRIDCAFHRDGWIQAIHTESELPRLENRARQMRARGQNVQMLDRTEVAALTGTDIYAGGYLDADGGGLNPMSLARGMAEAAQGAGARIHTDSPATAVTRDAKGGWCITTPRGTLHAAQVVMATGVHSGAVTPALQRSVLPVQSIQIATAPLPPDVRGTLMPEGHVVSDTRRLLLYFRVTEEGRLVFGGRGALGGEAIRAGHVDMLERTMRRSFPQITDAPVTHHWAGQVDLTVDRRLRIHWDEHGLWSVIGFSGRGVAIAPAVGRAVADAVLAQSPRDLPLPITPVRPVPFHALRKPAMSVAIGISRLRDRLEGR